MATIRPFWTKVSKQWSSALWLPPEKMTSCVLHENTWFSSRQHSDVQSHAVPAIPVVTEDSVPTKPPLKVEKIRIYPTTEQKQTLNQWMGTARWTYNQCLTKLKTVTTVVKEEFRSEITANSSPIAQANLWMTKTPRNIREYALSELLEGYFTNLKKGTPFQMKFRSRKDPSNRSPFII
jgi:hypothetical protein